VHLSLPGEADVAAMDNESGEPVQQIPSAAAASQAVSVAVDGRRSSVTVTTAQAASDQRSTISPLVTTGQETEPSFWNVSGGQVPPSAPPLSGTMEALGQWLGSDWLG